MLHGDTCPMIHSVGEPVMTGLPPHDNAALAGTLGDRRDACQTAQSGVISSLQGIEGFCQQRGEDDPSHSRQGCEDLDVMLLPLPRLRLGWDEASGESVDLAVGLDELPVHEADASHERGDMGAGGFGRARGDTHGRLAHYVEHMGGVEAADAIALEKGGDCFVADLVGMEACGTAHHWAREVSKLGHTVRLMPPSYVKGYVKRSKNDAADATAICEAVTRPSMRFVPIKSADQQALLMLHRTRDLLIRQRTQLINALRAHLAEFGLVAETGREGLTQLGEIITDESNREALPSAMKQALQAIVDQLAALELRVGALDRAIHAHHRANDMSCRLETVPGIGVIGATA